MLSRLIQISSDRKKSLLLILAISLAIKLVGTFMIEIINADAVRYINSAHELFNGNFAVAFAHEKMLGFSTLLGLTHLLISDWFWAGKVLSAASLLLATIPLYFITHRLFGERAAFCAALCFSVLPFVNERAAEVIKDPVFLLFFLIALWLLLDGMIDQSPLRMALAGCVSLVALSFRIEAVVLLGLVSTLLLLFVLVDASQRQMRFRLFLAYVTAPGLVLVIAVALLASGAISPELLAQIQEKFGYYFSLDLLENSRAIYAHLKQVERNFSGGQWSNDFFEFARHHLLLVYLFGMVEIFLRALFPLLLIPLCFGVVLKGRWSYPLILFLGVLFGYLLMDYLFLVKNNFLAQRYMLAPVVMSLVLVGYGMSRMLLKAESGGKPKYVVTIVLMLCFLAPAAKSIYMVGGDEKVAIKNAGLWLGGQPALDKLHVATNEERVAYYAGLMRESYQMLPPSVLLETCQGCDLVVLALSRRRNEPAPTPEHFTLVESFEDRMKTILIYERNR